MAKTGEISFHIDIEQFENYKANLIKSASLFKNFEERYLNALAARIMERAIPRTPVDTGRLARSYKVTKCWTEGDDLYIQVYNDATSNGNLDSYASYVEYGHLTRNRVSWVEGYWMLTVSTQEVEQDMQRVFNNMFADWCKETGI